MGGHGGLNILPQKRWNVYNYENREKVRKDEAEQAAREQALAEEQRRRDSELRLQTLRARARQQHLPLPQQQAAQERLLPPQDQAAHFSAEDAVVVADSSRLAESLDISTRDSAPQAGSLKSGHINLFEGLDSADFSALACGAGAQASDAVKPGRAQEVWEKEHKAGEEEKHRLGYGAVGKGGQQPWYARAGDLTVGEEEGGAGKIKGDAGGSGVGKRRLAEAAEVKTDSRRVGFQAPQKSDSERVKRVGPGEAPIHPAKDKDRDDTGDDDDEDMSSPRHKKERKHRRRRSASPDSSSSTSHASSDDDDANHHGLRRRRSRKPRKKQRVKTKISAADRSSSESPSSSSSDSDSSRGVRKKTQRSRRRFDSPDSSSASSLASSDDDDNRHHHRRSSKHRKKHHEKRRFLSSDRSPCESPSSSSSDSDSDRRVGRGQGSRRRHSGRNRSMERGGQHRHQEHIVGKRQGRETHRGLGARRGRKASNERGTGRRKREDAAAEEGMRCELKGAAAERGKKSIEALRAERVAREARERERAQMLLLQHHQAAGGRGLGGSLGSGAAGVGNTSGVRELGGGVEGNGLFGGIVMHGPETGQRRKEARYTSGFGYGR